MIWRKQANLWRTITRPDVGPYLTNERHQAITRSRTVSGWSVDAIARVLVKAKRSFGAHVCFTPNSGARAVIPELPLWGQKQSAKSISQRRAVMFEQSAKR